MRQRGFVKNKISVPFWPSRHTYQLRPSDLEKSWLSGMGILVAGCVLERIAPAMRVIRALMSGAALVMLTAGCTNIGNAPNASEHTPTPTPSTTLGAECETPHAYLVNMMLDSNDFFPTPLAGWVAAFIADGVMAIQMPVYAGNIPVDTTIETVQVMSEQIGDSGTSMRFEAVTDKASEAKAIA
ncbi:MAG: hypothetical protein FWG47_08450, partial [Propionibacteriaceae bacterium]|nr:hypothetical protein [Propionibacteriaceae bacterium]